MKITVFGATGLIGSKVVDLLNEAGHDVVAASRASGADVLTGEGLTDALAGTDALVDLTNSPSFDDGPVMDFFTRSSAKPRGGREADGGPPLRGPVDRRGRRFARQRLHARKGGAGEGDRRIGSAVHDRAGDPVPGVRRRHRRITRRGRCGAGTRRT